MQSGAPSHKYWIEMHLPSIGQRNGSNALHFVSKIKWCNKKVVVIYTRVLYNFIDEKPG